MVDHSFLLGDQIGEFCAVFGIGQIGVTANGARRGTRCIQQNGIILARQIERICDLQVSL